MSQVYCLVGKTDPFGNICNTRYLSCIVFENNNCLIIWYAVAKMYSESSNCSDPVIESRSGKRIVLINSTYSDHVRLHYSSEQNVN